MLDFRQSAMYFTSPIIIKQFNKRIFQSLRIRSSRRMVFKSGGGRRLDADIVCFVQVEPLDHPDTDETAL